MKKIILASASPRRSELLRAAGVVFDVVPSETEELADAFDKRELPLLNARLKAESVLECYPDAVVIGADTIVLCRNKVLGKPRDMDEARRMLRFLSGRMHEVLTGVTVLASPNFFDDFTVTTQVTFKVLSDAVIDQYLSKVHVLDKAGAYAIQEHGDLLVGSVAGQLDNVIGLPVQPLLRTLRYFH